MKKVGRRFVLRAGAQVVLAVPLVSLLAGRAKAAESCVDHASESLRESLHYVAITPDAAKPCKACAFFKSEDASACGPCDILSGPVDATGHCDSWSAKSG